MRLQSIRSRPYVAEGEEVADNNSVLASLMGIESFA